MPAKACWFESSPGHTREAAKLLLRKHLAASLFAWGTGRGTGKSSAQAAPAIGYPSVASLALRQSRYASPASPYRSPLLVMGGVGVGRGRVAPRKASRRRSRRSPLPRGSILRSPGRTLDRSTRRRCPRTPPRRRVRTGRTGLAVLPHSDVRRFFYFVLVSLRKTGPGCMLVLHHRQAAR